MIGNRGAPSTAYVRDSFVNESLRDLGQPDDGSAAAIELIGEAQDRWHLWLAAHDAELTEKFEQLVVKVCRDDLSDYYGEVRERLLEPIRALTPKGTES
jgi:hypothetical protein